jgi:hypothetical protein
MQWVISEWRNKMAVVLQVDESGLQGGTRECGEVTSCSFAMQAEFRYRSARARRIKSIALKADFENFQLFSD